MVGKRQFSLFTFIAVTGGAGLVLAAGLPILFALVVSNRLLDDGVQPNDVAVIARWDSWAFSVQNYLLLAIGMATIAIGIVARYWRRA